MKGLVGPSTPAPTSALIATSLPKVVFLVFSSPALERSSGRCAAWPHAGFRNTTCAALSPYFKAWPEVNSHSVPASTPRHSESRKTLRSSVQGPGTSSNPGGLGWRVTSGEGRRAHSSGFAPGVDALGWIFGLRMKPLCVSVVLKAATLPSSISLSPSPPLCTPPFCLYGWLVRQRQ